MKKCQNKIQRLLITKNMDTLSANNLWLFLIFFVPGFISIKIYDLLIPNQNRDFSKSLLETIAFSAINLALLFLPIFFLLRYRIYENYPISFAIIAFIIIFIFPIALSLFYVKIINTAWVKKYIVHPIKLPWDWLFSKREPLWVIITLKDGRKIGGIFSNKSYASSFPLPEQIYLETIWNLDETGRFISPIERSKGVIILNGEMSTLEFLEG